MDLSSALQRLDENINGLTAQFVDLVHIRKHASVFVCLLLATLVVFAFVTLDLPGNTLLIGAIQNAGHTLVFFALTIPCLVFTQYRTTNLSVLLLVTCLLFGFGLFIELAQHITGRGFTRSDVIRNGLGIGAAYFGFIAFQRRTTMHRATRVVLMLFAVAMIAVSLRRVTLLLVSSLFAPSVPNVVTFDQWGADLWVQAIGGEASVAHHNEIWPSNATKSVKVRFDTKKWRELKLLDPPADWTGYDTLSYSVFNPSTSPAEVLFRIDEPDKELNLREGTTFRQHLATGESVVTIDLKQIRHRFSTELNYESPPLTQVLAISFFSRDKEQPKVLYFDNFLLTRKASRISAAQ